MAGGTDAAALAAGAGLGRATGWLAGCRRTAPAQIPPSPPIYPGPCPTPITMRRARPDDAAAFAAMMSDPEVLRRGCCNCRYATESDGAHASTEERALRRAPTCSSGGRARWPGRRQCRPAPGCRRCAAAMSPASACGRPGGAGAGRGHGADGGADRLGRQLGAAPADRADGVHRQPGAPSRCTGSSASSIEGTHRAYALRDGAYVDVHGMARLHPKPPALAWPET